MGKSCPHGIEDKFLKFSLADFPTSRTFGIHIYLLNLGMKLHAALHACTTMNENQVQQTRQYGKI